MELGVQLMYPLVALLLLLLLSFDDESAEGKEGKTGILLVPFPPSGIMPTGDLRSTEEKDTPWVTLLAVPPAITGED